MHPFVIQSVQAFQIEHPALPYRHFSTLHCRDAEVPKWTLRISIHEPEGPRPMNHGKLVAGKASGMRVKRLQMHEFEHVSPFWRLQQCAHASQIQSPCPARYEIFSPMAELISPWPV